MSPNVPLLERTLLAGVAEFERAMNSERTKEGMKAAKARGKHVGRPRALSPEQVAHAKEQIEAGKKIGEMAELLGVNRVTLRNAMSKIL